MSYLRRNVLSLLARTPGAEKSKSRDRSEPFTSFSYKAIEGFSFFPTPCFISIHKKLVSTKE